jgi:hypothetical protein
MLLNSLCASISHYFRCPGHPSQPTDFSSSHITEQSNTLLATYLYIHLFQNFSVTYIYSMALRELKLFFV